MGWCVADAVGGLYVVILSGAINVGMYLVPFLEYVVLTWPRHVGWAALFSKFS